MEGEGDETVDTLPGDLVFMLQQKPHARLRRSGMEPCCSIAVSAMCYCTVHL